MAFTSYVSTTVISETVSSGTQNINSGGNAVSTTINHGGRQKVNYSGTTVITTINSGGYQDVYSGGNAVSTTINSGGDQYVSLGGTANRTAINSGGDQYVYSGGNAVSTTINLGGDQNVNSGGNAVSTIINSGGSQDVFSGGTANSTMVNSGGSQYVGGTANSTTVNSGGSQYVGGTANSTTINDGGNQYIYGEANYATINSGGVQDVAGDANYTTINSSGYQDIHAGGNAVSTTINSGGYQNVNYSGTTNSTMVNSGGWQDVSYGGTANYAMVKAGGMLMIGSGGSAAGFTISSGGILGWDFNAIFSGTSNGSTITSSSGKNSYNLYLRSSQYVYSGYTANNTTIISGGFQNVIAGGIVNRAVVNSDGSQIVYYGGIANHTTVNNAGSQYISSGGSACYTTVNSGGILLIGSGGSANNFTISSGGIFGWNFNAVLSGTSNGSAVVSSGTKTSYNMYFNTDQEQDVYWGYTANTTTINSGASQFIYASGSAAGTIVNSSGFQYISSGGMAQNTTINSGGSQSVSSGGSVTGTLTIAGGQVTLANASAVSASTTIRYVLTNAQANQVLLLVNSGTLGSIAATYSLNLNDAVSGTYILADGGGVSGMSGKNFAVTDKSQNINLQVGSSYIFAGGDSLSLNFANGQLTAAFTHVIPPQITIAATDSAAGEPANDGTFRISRTESTDKALTVYFNVGGTATGGSDYTLKNGSTTLTDSVVIAAGQSYVDVTLDVIDDNVVESAETAVMNLAANATYVLGATTSATINITDNDVPDTTPPTVPAGLKQTVTGSSVAFDWNDSTDAGGIKQYEVREDNNSDFSSPEYSKQVAVSEASVASLAIGTYYWQVRAQDNAGNWSAWSSSSRFFVTPADTAGNTPDMAQDISKLDNWVGFGDAADVYKLTMTNAGTLTLGLIGLTGNADLSLLSSTGTVLKSSSNTGTTPEAINNVALLAGTYYIKVAAGTGVNDATYTLTNAIKYCPTDIAANDYKTALDISNLDNWVGFGDAADFYKLTLTNAGTLTLGLTGLTGNADLSLLSSTGTVLKSSSNTGIADEAITNVALLAGTYYVKVAAGTSVNDASYTLSNTIKYCPTDTASNDYKTALDISNLDNWVGFGDSADFYKLTMTNAGTLTLGLTGLTGNADLSLLSSTGTVLKSSSNTGIADEAITNVALLAGTYYVKVAAGTSVNDASYTLSHTEKYCPTDTAANDYKTALDISNLDNWVGFGDSADFYKLTMTNAGTLSLGLTGLTGNADLSLLSSTGTVLKSSSNTGITPEAINNVALLAGTYYVKVAAGTSVNDASYTLSHTEKYCPTDIASNDYKTALDISNLDNWVGFGDAADFYKLTMTNAGTLTLGLTGLTGNADLSLLSSTGTVLKSSSNTGTTSEAITNVALLAGTYYVKVAAGTSVNDATYTLTNAIKYCPTDIAANDYKTAQDISNLDNWVGFGDAADFYKLTMANAGTLTLGLTGLTGNADLSLLNASGIAVKTSSNTGNTSEAINNVALLAGTYYVKVAAGSNVNDASYALSNTIKYCPTDTASNDYKTALDISNLDNWVGFGDAADFYKLTMTNAGTLTLGLTGLTGNADLSLLSSTGTVLKSTSNTGIADEAITNVALLAGTYYVKVAAGSSVNDATYTLSNTVNYFPGDTSDKAGNTIAAAKLIDAPAQTGWVGFGDTDDYYRFDLDAAAQGTLRLHDMAGGNADLTLYDAKGTQLKKSASLGTLEDTITSTLAAGTYYARVTAVSGNIDYKLDFSKKDIVSGLLAS